MNTNNHKRFGWEAEASGTKPTLMQSGLEMIRAEQDAQLAANKLQNFIDSSLPIEHSGYSDYLMRSNKVFERKHCRLKLYFAIALSMLFGSILAVLEINGYLPQILPTALGGGAL